MAPVVSALTPRPLHGVHIDVVDLLRGANIDVVDPLRGANVDFVDVTLPVRRRGGMSPGVGDMPGGVV